MGFTGNTLCYWTRISGGANPETGISRESGSNMYSSSNNADASGGTFNPPARKFLFNVKLTF